MVMVNGVRCISGPILISRKNSNEQTVGLNSLEAVSKDSKVVNTPIALTNTTQLAR